MAKSVIDVTEDIEFSDIFYVDRDKKVGINWDEPPARLSISGSVTEALLNVQNLLRVTGSTALPRIAIGKSTSDHALDVSGSAQIYGATTITGSSVGARILTVQTKALVVSGSDGLPRVGIGQLSPNVALDVLGSATVSGSLVQSGSMTFNEGGVTITGSNVGTKMLNVNNILVVSGSTLNPRIGVGKTSSAFALDVTGSTQVYGPLFISGSTGEYNFNFNNVVTMSGSGPSSGRLGVNVGLTDGIDAELQVVGDTFLNGDFNQNNLVYMTGSLAGVPRVSIGKTTSDVPLDVVGTVAVLGSTVLSGSLSQSGSSTFNEGGATITGSSVGTKMLNVNDIFVVSGSTAFPRVGVGKTSSAYALDVTGSTNLYGAVTVTGSDVGANVLNINNLFVVSGSDALARVGIGKTTSDNMLDVSGSSKFYGPVTITGSNETASVLHIANGILMVSGSETLPRISIGKTTADYMLDVSGSSKFYGPMTVTGSDVTTSVFNANNLFIVTGSSALPRVAIGKTTSDYAFEVTGSTYHFGPVTVTGSDVGTETFNVNNILRVSGSTALPRIGIGKASSAYALDVTGSSYFYGPMTVTGSDIGSTMFDVAGILNVTGSATTPRVGVGKVSSAYSLDVTGSSYFFGPTVITGSDITVPVLTVSSKILTVSGSETNPMVGIGTNIPTNTLDVVGSSMRLRTGLGAQSGSAGQIGEIRWSGSILTGSAPAALYLCLTTGTWAVFSGSIMNSAYGLIPS